MGIANVIMRMIGNQLKNSYICRGWHKGSNVEFKCYRKMPNF